MLDLAGRVADGTVTSMTGPIGLEQHIVPRLTKAAAEAGRPAAAGVLLPARRGHRRRRRGAGHDGRPDGRLSRTCPRTAPCSTAKASTAHVDIAIIGNEQEVSAALGRIRSAGATDFIAAPLDAGEDRARTFAALQEQL